MTATALARLLARYARGLHGVADGPHHVASPLGAWLLLALCAPLARGPLRARLSEVLGTEPEEAASLAAGLLADPHPAVGCGAAVWSRSALDTEEVRDWKAGLPAMVGTGDIPDQATLDRWARERTLGHLERFPLEVDRSAVLVMASVLGTRVSWARPFDLVPASALGSFSAWSARPGQALHAPPGDPRHRAFIADTEAAGTVAVHTAIARDGLEVTSVAAATGVAPADVLATAHEIACTGAGTSGGASRRSLFELPVGEAPLWTIREEQVDTASPDGREELCAAVLPAWSAESDLDLAGPVLGFPAAAGALAEALRLDDYRYEARQSAVARYGRVGFEAAAVSALAIKTSARHRRPGLRRVGELHFGHPFAVVAVAVAGAAEGGHLGAGEGTSGRSWHGLPVFSAWVSEPEEPG